MRIVDAHHHLWDLDRHSYPWLDRGGTAAFGDYTPICKPYRVDDFLADVGQLELVKSVHVQAQIAPPLAVEETAWLQHVADTNPSGVPHGIVAFADLSQPTAADVLESHARHPNVRGIRQILNRHPDPKLNAAPLDYLRDETWLSQFGLLERHGLSFDLQIYYRQAAAAVALARRYPSTTFILNHAGMPIERGPDHEEGWRRAIEDLASCPNVVAKISGLGMCDPRWTTDSIRPFVEHALDAFGIQRCMFGSNFPVDRLFASYPELWAAYDALTQGFSVSERRALFAGNAIDVYRL